MGKPLNVAIFDCCPAQIDRTDPVMYLVFGTREVTAEEVIRLRVHHELECFQSGRNSANTLVSLGNGASVSALLDQLDVEKYCQDAIALFNRSGFFIIVDDKQLTETSDTVTLCRDSQIEFFRLTPLVGG